MDKYLGVIRRVYQKYILKTQEKYSELKMKDSEIFNLIKCEESRQFYGLELVASENFTSSAVMEANGSILTNKYSEGLPGKRYYGGNQFIDQIERLCQQRAMTLFNLGEEEWSVNVQPYSGSTANFSVFTALLKPGDLMMGLDLPSGGHLTHGYQHVKKDGSIKKVSSSSIYFSSRPYKVSSVTGLIDYETLEKEALKYKPKLIICGASAYPRDIDYKYMRRIADSCGSYLMADMAHISGLVATQEINNPFEYCDIVTTTTHKTLRGPRAGLIFSKKQFSNDIDFSVFPSNQGGPHNNTIAAVAVALKEAATPEFKQYIIDVKYNAKLLEVCLRTRGYDITTGGTDNHLFLWDLRKLGLTGSKMEKICEYVDITLNKNSIPGDTSAMSPGGVRIGTSALTTRNFRKSDFIKIGDILHETCQLALKIQKSLDSKLLKDFENALKDNKDVKLLKKRVRNIASQYALPL